MKNNDHDAVEFQRKYRPEDFSEMEGQTKAVAVLTDMRRNHRIPHAIAFVGPSGVGKTTFSRILKRKLHCDDRDYREVNMADSRGIDTIREIISQMPLAPMSGLTKIWNLEEAHQLTSAGQKSLLKPLEEPPAHVYFILTTTDWHKMLRAIQTRCTKIELKPLSKDALWNLLTRVVTAEKAVVSEEVLHAVIDHSDGSARMALNLLQKVISLPEEADRLLELERGPRERKAWELGTLLIHKRAPWPQIAALLRELDEDISPESIRHTVLAFASGILLKSQGRLADRAAQVIHSFECNWGDDKVVARASLLKTCFQLTN